MPESASQSLKLFMDDRAWPLITERLRLSVRESQIARAVFEDRKEAAIATSLGISPHTVRTHMERLYHKLGVQSRVELVVFILGEFLRLTADDDNELPPICFRRRTGECPFSDGESECSNQSDH